MVSYHKLKQVVGSVLAIVPDTISLLKDHTAYGSWHASIELVNVLFFISIRKGYQQQFVFI